MSEQHVEFTRRGVQAMNDGDAEAAIAVSHPEIEFRPLRSAISGPYVGHDGLREFFADTTDSFEAFHVQLDEVRDLGDGRTLSFGTLRVRTAGGGPEATAVHAAITEYRDGLAFRIEDFGDRARALEAAGRES